MPQRPVSDTHQPDTGVRVLCPETLRRDQQVFRLCFKRRRGDGWIDKGRKQIFNDLINIYLTSTRTHFMQIWRQTFYFSGVGFGEQMPDLRGATTRDHDYKRVRPAQRGRARSALEDYGFMWRNSTKRQETDLERGEPPKYGGRIAMVRCGQCEAGCLN